MDAALTPKRKRAPGSPRPAAAVHATLPADDAARLAACAKALSDPIRIQLVDVLARHPGQLCACELVPLFDIAQSTLAHHLKALTDAGVLQVRRQGLFAYYLVDPASLTALQRWVGSHAALD